MHWTGLDKSVYHGGNTQTEKNMHTRCICVGHTGAAYLNSTFAVGLKGAVVIKE